MYGFRSNRGCHDAVKDVHCQICNGHINHVVDAEKYDALRKERLKKFNLELEESKSRMIEFGRYAETSA